MKKKIKLDSDKILITRAIQECPWTSNKLYYIAYIEKDYVDKIFGGNNEKK